MITIIYVILALLALAGLGLGGSLMRGIRRRQIVLLLDQRRLVFMEERESLQEQYFEQASASGDGVSGEQRDSSRESGLDSG